MGKAVTFDTGGISLKPGAKMSEMKFDMSGGAAVLEAMGAIAELGLPITLTAVLGATENMPSGHAVKPGDIVTAMNGKTIEINNTDAEGRLVLADTLHYAIEQGAERVVNLATLTGAIMVALGSTHCGLFSNDDDWFAEVEAACTATGELGWRLPLHRETAKMVKGKYADLDNAPGGRKAGVDHRRRVPEGVRGRHAVGAHGHRRHRLGAGPPLRGQRRVGLRRAHADRAGARLRCVAPLLVALAGRWRWRCAACGDAEELSKEDAPTLTASRADLDDALDTEETLRTSTEEAAQPAHQGAADHRPRARSRTAASPTSSAWPPSASCASSCPAWCWSGATRSWRWTGRPPRSSWPQAVTDPAARPVPARQERGGLDIVEVGRRRRRGAGHQGPGRPDRGRLPARASSATCGPSGRGWRDRLKAAREDL